MMGVITALEIQKKNKQRVNVYIDDEYLFSLSLDDAARLRKGQTLTDAEIDALKGDDAIKKAMERAARLLASRPRSTQEIIRSLSAKETPPSVIDAAIAKLTELGYVDDRAFAAFWVQGRTTSSKPSSPKAIRYELRQKGVADAIIADVLGDVDADDSAYRAAHARGVRLRGRTRAEFRQNLSGFLARRGFPYSVVKPAVTRVIEALETDDPSFFRSDDDAAGQDDEL
jgi:regulatory protein